MNQIIFNSKKSYDDIGIDLEEFSIQPPSKKKIKESAPFVNGGGYDFSTVGSLGEIVYSTRIIKVRFNFLAQNCGSLYNKYSSVIDWLMGTGQSQLIFDDMPDCYFMAEVENAPNFEDIVRHLGRFEVEFICEPFKIGVSFEGSENILWDTFNFEQDYIASTQFNISGSQLINIYNSGRIVCPIVNCSAPMTIVMSGVTYIFSAGDNKNYSFKLQPGANLMTVSGTGTIKFIWRKQVI